MMVFKDRFAGRNAIVTGGASGIGFAVVERLFAEGAKVAIADVNLEVANQSALKLDPTGEQVIAVQCDVSSFESSQAMVETVLAKFGRIDILINNAGITKDKMFHKMDPAQWNAVININLTGMFNVTRNVIPYMREQKYGRVVCLSSTSAVGEVGQANYSASKAGVIGFVKTLAKELAKHGVNVNCVLPEFTETEMTKKMPKEVYDELVSHVPIGRAAQPYEQAAAIAFLASEEASFITGAALETAGGNI